MSSDLDSEYLLLLPCWFWGVQDWCAVWTGYQRLSGKLHSMKTANCSRQSVSLKSISQRQFNGTKIALPKRRRALSCHAHRLNVQAVSILVLQEFNWWSNKTLLELLENRDVLVNGRVLMAHTTYRLHVINRIFLCMGHKNLLSQFPYWEFQVSNLMTRVRREDGLTFMCNLVLVTLHPSASHAFYTFDCVMVYRIVKCHT